MKYVMIFFVCQGSSEIRSNANLGVHGQGSLNLSGPGDVIEAQHLVLSLFYTINVRLISFNKSSFHVPPFTKSLLSSSKIHSYFSFNLMSTIPFYSEDLKTDLYVKHCTKVLN